MRMPNAREISEEQQDIFEDAPLDGCILVSGPPGTGKTVIAFLRAKLLAQKKQEVVVLMYNRVLRRYTENIAKEIEGKVDSKTMHTWLPDWWKLHRIPNPTSTNTLIIEGGKAYVNCPYDERNDIKKLNGHWDENKHNPFTNKRGMWYVPLEIYKARPNTYSRWTGPFYDPIMLERWKYNWSEMRSIYLDLDENKMIDWGHLIIDEGQDFEPGLYSFLYMAGKQLNNGGMTILADENQRLDDDLHSSLQDIRAALKLNDKPEREFRLTKNFRNTKQIAEVARHFYVGLETGMPVLPDRNGNKPVLIVKSSTEQQISYICNYLRFRGALEVGIIVDNDTDREFFTTQLSVRLKNYFVQSYSTKNYKSSESLLFDKQGVITVLHRKSCKGLEFDTVFVPELQSFAVDDSNLTTFKMNMYVICSRARSELVFMCNDGEMSNPAVLQYLPPKESGLIDYREQK